MKMSKSEAKYVPLKDDPDASAPEDDDERKPQGITDCLEKKCGYPVQVYFILGNEFCERFSYYGMHAILVIYLTNMIKMSKDDATAVYHAFNMLCYFSPIFGAILADSFWGKYKTILYVSLIYAVGNIVVSVTSVPAALDALKFYGPAVGLFLIAMGTGGIKPCVSAFGGDQFKAGQEDMLQSFFSIFYFAINFGSLLSMLITPILRGDVSCFGHDCYPLAFGVPAVLMVVSVVLFVAGTSLYTRVPPEGNVVVEVSKAVGCAWKERVRHCGSGISKHHWMDWAEQHYDPLLISDIKALFKVLFMFLPLPVFWTLFDQQGSRWTLQAMEMNGDIGVFGTLKPDQMQALNPVFVMILIPFVEAILYPLAKKCGLLAKPLQKMACGMALAALAFVAAGFLQMKLQDASSVAKLPATGFANYRFINTVPCDILIYSKNLKTKNVSLDYQKATEYFAVPVKFRKLHMSTAPGCPQAMSLSPAVAVKEKESYSLIIASNHSSMVVLQLTDEMTPLAHGRAKVRFVHAAASVKDDVTVKLNDSLSINLAPLQEPSYTSIMSRHFKVRVSPHGMNNAIGLGDLHFGNGGIYTVVIQPNKEKNGVHLLTYPDVSPRPVSILWQIPQYLIITLGEVMFSITGLEFAYSQSPPSMKSCIMAAWLLTVSLGNLLVVILAGLRLTEDMAKEFFFFSILLAVVTIVFVVMAYFYKYVNYGSSRNTTGASLDSSGGSESIPLTRRDPDDVDRPPDMREASVAKLGSLNSDAPSSNAPQYGSTEAGTPESRGNADKIK